MVIILLTLTLALASPTHSLASSGKQAIAPALSSPVHRTFYLLGNAILNWNGTVSNPGPLISVFDGDSVSILYNSVDSFPHTWFIDLNNNLVPDPGEIISSTVVSTTVFFNFTFTPKIGTNMPAAGNFTYRCSVHAAMMHGIFQLIPATVDTSINTSLALQGVNVVTSGTLTIDMRSLAIQGSLNVVATNATTGATVFSKAYVVPAMNLISHGGKPGAFFGLNVAVLPYALSVDIAVVLSGITASNTVKLSRELDINGDGLVNILDVSAVASSYGSLIGSTLYNPRADFNVDGAVNILDVSLIASFYSSTVFH